MTCRGTEREVLTLQAYLDDIKTELEIRLCLQRTEHNRRNISRCIRQICELHRKITHYKAVET